MLLSHNLHNVRLNLRNSPNETILVNGTNFAYRRLGASSGVPLVFIIHFRGNMDHWDPALIDPIAAVRPVILIDNAGVGRSDGEIPDNLPADAQNIIEVLSALDIKQADVLGFSLGGCVAQLVALNAPNLVRRLILVGMTPSIGEDMEKGDPKWVTMLATAVTEEETEKGDDCMFLFAQREEAGGRREVVEEDDRFAERSCSYVAECGNWEAGGCAAEVHGPEVSG